MGVPSFFKWLARKYPKILVNAIETYPETDADGNLINPDTSLPNPNDVEYDCLYLDMNGIIHPCTHPENRPAPSTEEEMMLEIFLYIDRLFNIVRPRRLVYFAIDGVAPRAKMNQQRSRRFKSAKETRENKIITEQLISDLKERGLYNEEPQEDEAAKWDRNQITPGTPFMAKVADALRYYILGKITTDPGWKNVACILSDSNVPGEGEHKLMEYIRYQHSQEGYNANTRHCICGLDADLIMLGLATHEPHFSILREDVLIDKKPLVEGKMTRGDMYKHDPFQFLCLNVMREYLELELKPRERTVFEFDLERAIDDYVFLCFFVGNDFLPHIPTLEIRDDAITKLIKTYRELLPQLDGYLTENGKVHFNRVHEIFKPISSQEDAILAKKREKNLFSRQRSFSQGSNVRGGFGLPNEMRSQDDFVIQYDPNASFKDHIKAKRKQLDDQRLARFKEKEFDEDADPVRLGTLGWRERYYKAKFGVDMSDTDFFEKLTNIYAEGLQWVMKYYYQGCASWDWYYPFHYPPFISDVSNVATKTVYFNTDTKPFAPFEQLLAVLPADSSQFLPPAYADLMCDPSSPISDFFPLEFKEDPNGKPFAWQAIALLPFIDEKRLKKTIEEKGLDSTFTQEEKERNAIGETYIFCSRSNPLASSIMDLDNQSSDKLTVVDSSITPFFGSLSQAKFASYHSRFLSSPVNGLPDLINHNVVFACYHYPEKKGDFISKLRPGLVLPPPVLTMNEINRQKLYYSSTEQQQNRPMRASTDSYFQQSGGPARPSYGGGPHVNSHGGSHVPSNNYYSRDGGQESYFRRDGNNNFNNNNFNNNNYGMSQQNFRPQISQQNFNNNNNFNNINVNNTYSQPRTNYSPNNNNNNNNNFNNNNFNISAGNNRPSRDDANIDIAQQLRNRLNNNNNNDNNNNNNISNRPSRDDANIDIAQQLRNRLENSKNSFLGYINDNDNSSSSTPSSSSSSLNNNSGSYNNNNSQNFGNNTRNNNYNNNNNFNNNNFNSQQRGPNQQQPYNANRMYNNNNNNNSNNNYNNNNNNGRYQSTTGNF